jgi:5-methyltetrahydrofolate--homocysteine methyltransferase
VSDDLTQLPLEELLEQIQDNLYGGNAEPVVAGVHELLRRGLTPYGALTQGLIAGMDVVGEDFRTGKLLAPLGDLERADAVKGFAEQAAALRAGGVDVLWIETMSALEEVEAAVEGVRQAAPGVPVVVTMSFDTHGHTMMGVSPEQAARDLTALGAVAVGGNCGLGPAELLPAMVAMRASAPGAVLVAKPNAGLPELEDGKAVYRGSPGEMADYARRLTAAGVRIVGGCCGSAPAHLRAMADALGGTP